MKIGNCVSGLTGVGEKRAWSLARINTVRGLISGEECVVWWGKLQLDDKELDIVRIVDGL